MDVDEMAPGANFLEVIERSLEESAVFVAVIGTNWRGPLSTGGQRIDQPGDFVRHEVSRALEREDVLVVPVLVRGARMAAASELPGELRALASLHAHELTHPRWNYDLDRLVSRVRESLPSHDTASRDLNSVLRSMRSDFQFLTRVFMQRPTLTISAFVLALCWIWLSATGPVLAEAGIDVPVVPHSLPERFVLTDLTTDAVSLRVQGVRSHVTELLQRNDLEYPLNLSAANLGESWYEVNELLVSLPDGIRVVSRAPSQIRAKFDLRSQRFVRVRPDIVGEPAPGFILQEVSVVPPRVRISGARSSVLRVSEVSTETVDLDGVAASFEKEVRFSLQGENMWIDDAQSATLTVTIRSAQPESS